MKIWTTLLMAGVVLAGTSVAWSATDADLSAQVQILQQRVAELEAKQTDQAIQQKNAELIRQLVTEMAANQKNAAADTGMTAGYDKRFFIKSADDQFKLQFDTLLQFRYSYLLSDDGDKNLQKDGTRYIYDADFDDYVYTNDGVDSSAQGFDLERARLYLTGQVLKDLKYKIVLEGDDDSNGSKGVYMYEYELNYSFIPELGARLGKYKVPFGKQEPGSSGKLMLVDRALATDVFNLDRGTGVEAFGTFDLGEIKPEYRAMVFTGFRNNDNVPVAQNDNSPSLATRLAIPLMGASMEDFADESDLSFHENPVALIGTSYAYANDRNENHFSGGESNSYKFLGKSAYDGRGDVYTLGGEANLISADVSFKYMGLSMTAEGYYQHITTNEDVDNASDFGNDLRSGIDGHQMDNYGWYTQAGYFIVPKVFEVVSRVGSVCVDNANDSYEYAGGWNWYLSGQDLKLSMDITYIDDLPITNSSSNFDGVQNNALFLIRSQLQFQF